MALKRTANVLDKYRTYAYQFAICLCDSTQTADALSISKDLNQFKHPTDSKYAAKPAGSGEYVVLINTMEDADFVVVNFKYQNVFMNSTMGSNGVSFANTMSFEGSMDIQEPLGVRFYNVIANATQTLNTNLVGCIWLVKPIFVGHTFDNKVSVEANLKPIYLIPYDVTSSVDETVTNYHFEFAGASNGFSKSGQVSNLIDGISLSTATNDKSAKSGPITVLKGMELLQTKINDQYERFKTDLKKQVSEQTAADGFDPDVYKKVTYEIKLAPDSYEDAKYKIGTDSHEELTETGNNDPVASWGYKGASIETVITQMLKSSKEIKEESVQVVDGKRYFPKITTAIESSLTDYKVVYTINRYEYIGYTPQNHVEGSEPPIPEEATLFLNYIFTGQNLDIIQFDINMEFGLSFLMSLSTTPNLPRPDSTTNKITTDGKIYRGPTPAQSARGEAKTDSENPNSNTPLFLGGEISSPINRNKLYPITNGDYNSVVQRHAAYETIETKVKIRGNPVLLTPSIKKVLPQAPPDGEVPFADNFESQPGFAKIAVKFPDVPGSNPNQKYSDFWYKGFYIIFAIDHLFEGGMFTQDIEMVGMPTFDNKDRDDEGKNQEISTSSAQANSSGRKAENLSPSTTASNKKPLAKNIPTGEATGGVETKPLTVIGKMAKVSSQSAAPVKRAAQESAGTSVTST